LAQPLRNGVWNQREQTIVAQRREQERCHPIGARQFQRAYPPGRVDAACQGRALVPLLGSGVEQGTALDEPPLRLEVRARLAVAEQAERL
jgi:hypothetical protein